MPEEAEEAAGGIISGGGFSLLGGGNILDGMWKGAIGGLFGGGIGSYIGGGEGSFLGGAISGGIGTALNGGDPTSIVQSALLGGMISLGAYYTQEASAHHNYKKAGGQLSYQQYSKMSAAAQRSFSQGKEYGGWILKNGDVEMWPVGGKNYVEPTSMPGNAKAEFHTHPNWGKGVTEMHGSLDIAATTISSYVIGRQNVWHYYPGLNVPPFLLHSSLSLNVYPYRNYWYGY